MLELKLDNGKIKGKIAGDTHEIVSDLIQAVGFIYAEYLKDSVSLEDFANIFNQMIPQYLETEPQNEN